jgi:CheY-like chemotaxis protein
MNGETDQSPLCILVIDDNRDAVDVFGLLLKKLGHRVHTSQSGESALEQIETLQPDLVFLDLGMPHIDGYEVARRMRRHPKLKDARIVAVTGYVDRRRREMALEAGFDEYLIKPTSIADIQAVIEGTRDLLSQSGHAPHSNC